MKASRSICHPGREAYFGQHCRECWAAKDRGRLHTNMVARVLKVEQRAYDRVPDECPHCHRPLLQVDEPVISCPGWLTGCGWTGFLVTPGVTARAPAGQRGRARGSYDVSEVAEQ